MSLRGAAFASLLTLLAASAAGCADKGDVKSGSAAVTDGVGRWVGYLKDPDLAKREGSAASLASHSPEELKTVLPELQAAVKDEPDPRVKKMLQFAIDKAQGRKVGQPPGLAPRR